MPKPVDQPKPNKPEVVEVVDENKQKLEAAHRRGPLAGFLEFIRQQGTIGLAVGFILGDSVKQVVSGIVNDIVNPVIGLFLGKIAGGNLENASLHVGSVVFTWGHLTSTIIDFIVVAAVVYFVIKGLKLDKLDLPKKV